ncbi:hypothetical protein WEI85_35045 [Actinomycetes bacterium KLBMP 9797]
MNGANQGGTAAADHDRDLAGRPALLIIDNFDHWSDAALVPGASGTVRPRLCGGFCRVDHVDALGAVA